MRVTGIGGVFFESPDPERLYQWYEKHLGIKREPWGVAFNWADDPHAADGATAWSIFPQSSNHFAPSSAQFMINFRVADLEALLRRFLRTPAGKEVPASGSE